MPGYQDLVGEARTTNDEKRLRALSTHRVTAVRTAVAGNPATPVDVLEVLAEDKHHLPRYEVTSNPRPEAVAVSMAARRSDVRVILAQRHDLPAEVYEALFSDPDRQVRESLATSTDRADLVARFAQDEEVSLRALAAIHPLCSDADFERLSRDPSNRVRATVAGERRRLSEDMVQRLARDRSANVRWHVLTHHRDRRDLAELLAQDADEMNAAQARHHLAELDRRDGKAPT
ncbi:hypothetical protein L2K70_12180 [Nocardioides KLBMP 9356]|uniref:Leucine rich repeat variant n=1 Tax=Nocardioides potassii TaxID=2911371 RepID=A0ABS9HE25_9ACTN|nr:hypothetical protein [Nocardioides potassii]MCF6378363.1 hypothetical protein [Nocardioides potassii]